MYHLIGEIEYIYLKVKCVCVCVCVYTHTHNSLPLYTTCGGRTNLKHLQQNFKIHTIHYFIINEFSYILYWRLFWAWLWVNYVRLSYYSELVSLPQFHHYSQTCRILNCKRLDKYSRLFLKACSYEMKVFHLDLIS